jgi:hypothetical protein
VHPSKLTRPSPIVHGEKIEIIWDDTTISGIPVLEYELYSHYEDQTALIYQGPEKTFTMEYGSVDTDYSFTVVARNAFGRSDISPLSHNVHISSVQQQLIDLQNQLGVVSNELKEVDLEFEKENKRVKLLTERLGVSEVKRKGLEEQLKRFTNSLQEKEEEKRKHSKENEQLKARIKQLEDQNNRVTHGGRKRK